MKGGVAEYDSPAPERRRGGRGWRVAGGILAVLIGLPLVLGVALVLFAGWETVPWHPVGGGAGGSSGGDAGGEVARLAQEEAKLADKLASCIPKGTWIVVSTVDNRLFLRKGDDLERTSVCSTGSYRSLEGPEGQKWFFMTPRGRFTIKSKQQDPVWIKPDWAFVEDGDPIPAKNSKERYEPGVLGLYALGFGNGYFIHGTLYTRLLGRNVTHGCIRLPDDDIEAVYKAAPVGTQLFIY